MDDRRLDPTAPLPGPPDPWAETEMPSLRDGPPWHMTEMIEAEPALAVRILDRLEADGSAAKLAALVREFSDAGRPIITVGCGTSEHGAQAVAEILRGAVNMVGGWTGAGEAARPVSVQAFEAMEDLEFGSHHALVIAVSHEGATWATMWAADQARINGAKTALITVSDRSPWARAFDVVLQTHELDQSWCHTVGYVSPIVAACAVEKELWRSRPGEPVELADSASFQPYLATGLAPGVVAAAERVAGHLAACDRIVTIATGVDRIAARELTLKIEEGAHIATAFRDVETLLHGHLAGMDERTGLVAIATDSLHSGANHAKRLREALAAAREIGVRSSAIMTAEFEAGADLPDDLTPAGRIVMDAEGVLGAGPAILATAIPLQLLTERIARVRGVNPDPIRRDDPRYLKAASAGSPGD
jgi:glucosamine 6-phosphate synthetase-like amidotransferase/phosphosugar isomerase protein